MCLFVVICTLFVFAHVVNFLHLELNISKYSIQFLHFFAYTLALGGILLDQRGQTNKFRLHNERADEMKWREKGGEERRGGGLGGTETHAKKNQVSALYLSEYHQASCFLPSILVVQLIKSSPSLPAARFIFHLFCTFRIRICADDYLLIMHCRERPHFMSKGQ